MQVHETYLDDARDGRCYVIEDAEKKRTTPGVFLAA